LNWALSADPTIRHPASHRSGVLGPWKCSLGPPASWSSPAVACRWACARTVTNGKCAPPRRQRLFLPTATGLERATRTILREFLLQPTRAPTGTQLDFFTQPMDSSLAEDVFVRRTLLGALRQAALAVCPQLVLAEQALSRESDEQLPWLYAAPVFSHPYILSDIARYRPAALAALGLEWRREAPSWCMAMAPTPQRVASLMAAGINTTLHVVRAPAAWPERWARWATPRQQ
jgi:hypothetical protein